MCKKMWQSFLSVTVAAMLVVASFLSQVHADEATLTDLYNLLYSIDQALSSPSSSRSTDLIYRFTELKQDFEWLFGKNGDGAGDGHINYVLNNQAVNGSTMSIAMGDLITQQNEILMTLVSSYVDASDPDNIVVKPGVLSQLSNILDGINSNSITDASILTTVNSMLSDTTAMKNSINNIYQLLFDRLGFDIPVYSWSAFDGVLRGSFNLIQVDKFGCYVSGSDLVNRTFRFNASQPTYFIYAVTQYNATLDNFSSGTGVITKSINSNSLYFKVYSLTGTGWFTFNMPYASNNTNFKMYPIYFGPRQNLPNDLEYILGSQFTNIETELLTGILNNLKDSTDNVSWLQKIYNHIIGDPDSNNTTQQDIDSMNNKVDTIQDNLDNYSDQLDQNIDQVSPSGILNNVQQQGQKVNFLSGIIQQVFTSFGSYSWLFLLPLVFGLILMFMG